jgi:hypothetical protein
MKKLTFLLILFGIISCRTSKVDTQKSIIRVDTFRTEKIVHIYNSVKDTLLIENPCDSAGILTRFYSKITIPQGNIIIRSYKGNIKATVDLDSISKVYELKYQNKTLNTIHNIDKIVYRNIIPTWILLIVIFESLIIGVYIYFRFFFKL